VVSISHKGSVGSRTAMAIVENQIAIEMIIIDLSFKRDQQLEIAGNCDLFEFDPRSASADSLHVISCWNNFNCEMHRTKMSNVKN